MATDIKHYKLINIGYHKSCKFEKGFSAFLIDDMIKEELDLVKSHFKINDIFHGSSLICIYIYFDSQNYMKTSIFMDSFPKYNFRYFLSQICHSLVEIKRWIFATNRKYLIKFMKVIIENFYTNFISSKKALLTEARKWLVEINEKNPLRSK